MSEKQIVKNSRIGNQRCHYVNISKRAETMFNADQFEASATPLPPATHGHLMVVLTPV